MCSKTENSSEQNITCADGQRTTSGGVPCRRTASPVGEVSLRFSVHQQYSPVAAILSNCTTVYKEKSRGKVLISDGLELRR